MLRTIHLDLLGTLSTCRFQICLLQTRRALRAPKRVPTRIGHPPRGRTRKTADGVFLDSTTGFSCGVCHIENLRAARKKRVTSKGVVAGQVVASSRGSVWRVQHGTDDRTLIATGSDGVFIGQEHCIEERDKNIFSAKVDHFERTNDLSGGQDSSEKSVEGNAATTTTLRGVESGRNLAGHRSTYGYSKGKSCMITRSPKLPYP